MVLTRWRTAEDGSPATRRSGTTEHDMARGAAIRFPARDEIRDKKKARPLRWPRQIH